MKTRPRRNPKKPTFDIPRRNTRPGVNPLDEVRWKKIPSRILDPNGRVVSEMPGVEIPEGWSQLAADILASKYLRKSGVPGSGQETSARQVVERIVRAIRKQGERVGLLDRNSAEIFEAELSYLLIHQYAAFNSPVWFNLGLHEAYGIRSSSGGFIADQKSGKAREIEDALEHPQCSACFIQSVEDDLLSIFELAKTEARLFKYGSGTGTNFSKIRGVEEKLSGGGTSSGLMSFLEVLDRGAGATKSGGTTRRAAKMVCLDMDHPEILDFIRWKAREEEKARALIAAGYDSDLNGEAYHTVSGQNSNNSVRASDAFMNAVLEDREFALQARLDGRETAKLQARELWREISEAAWACADPGLQFDDTIQAWHTCPQTDRIRASNPCSEFMFLDDTACNLASLNLMRFLGEDDRFDHAGFTHAIRILITAQELLVGLSSYPTAKIAENSWRFRPLGLGYANLGALLMVKGLPYDSEEGREFARMLTALMTGEAYAVSAELAGVFGAFAGFQDNREPMLHVIEKHAAALVPAKEGSGAESLFAAARDAWARALKLGRTQGYRNAQVTVLAPTGTIGLLMDCDTTGVEPDFALVKFKKLAGGGAFKIVNHSVPRALRKLGYADSQVKEMLEYLLGTMNFPKSGPGVTREFLRKQGHTEGSIDELEARLPAVFDLSGLISLEGLSREVVEASNDRICGRMTLEGAPHLRPEHLPVFDCANRCGRSGSRFIAPLGHIRMMAAIQPFLSGAISKTVNLPSDTTVEQVEALLLMAWRSGLKSVAIYRDGCKASQPLLSAGRGAPVARGGGRKTLPERREGVTIEAMVGGKKVYLRTGEYPDGRLGELFLEMEKADPEYRALLGCFAIAVSLGLQYGVPLQEFVDRFAFTRFDPSGPVSGHPNVKLATSVIDFVFRSLGVEYLGRKDLAHVIDDAGSARLPRAVLSGDAIDDQLSRVMADAPKCDACGHATVRNGACFRCLHCGNSMGCS
jgi:ribonucleoside-diphosphate reductase alpha chain